jgi:hypothetical protein
VIDYAAIQRYDLRLTIYFDRWDDTWHAVICADNCQSVDMTDRDAETAIRNGVTQFINTCRPRDASTF